MQDRVVAAVCAALFTVVTFAAAPVRAFWPFAPAASRAPLARVRLPGQKAEAAATMSRQTMALAADLAAGLGRDCPGYGCTADGLVVTSFVDLKNLSRTSSFGRYLGEELMGEMQRRGFRVIEIRKSRDVLVASGFGEYGLSRDPVAIGTRAAATAILTGTYTVAGDGVVVNARIVDDRSGDVLASAARIFPLDRVLRSMLADAAAPGPVPSAPLYLKKLEM